MPRFEFAAVATDVVGSVRVVASRRVTRALKPGKTGRAKDRVLAQHPEAIAVREAGTFVGGTVRYKVLLTPRGRKVVGYGQRESWAWAEACRALGL